MSSATASKEIAGYLERDAVRYEVVILRGLPYSLFVRFVDEAAAASVASFDRLVLVNHSDELVLGGCRFVPHQSRPCRRRDDPAPEPGHGRLIFVDDVLDFSGLFRHGRVLALSHKRRQLDVIWQRKEEVRPDFRRFANDLLYDLQVYRAFFDEIDAGLTRETPDVRRDVQALVIRQQYDDFAAFMDRGLAELEHQTATFSRREHELHGYYFRKQLWDIIMCSALMRRTNLKPRGYPGDSEMMRMLYEQGFRGDSIFARLMHHHPVRHAAAEAVRYRRAFIAERLRARRDALGGGRRLRVLSVACGPAEELLDTLRDARDCGDFDFVLLDQDAEALEEARSTLARISAQHGGEVRAQLVRGSVRTLQNALAGGAGLDHFDFVYSLGLFDYLTPPVAKQVLEGLYAIAGRGGELLIGNFHPANPSRRYMEYWLDWVLFYRDEEELAELSSDLAVARRHVELEPARAQLLMTLHKDA